MRTVRTCPLCEALCGLVIEHDGDRVTSIRGNPDDVLSRGHVCPKAVALKDLHEDPDRLRRPVRRVGDRWVEIGWEEALDEAAERLDAVRRAHGRHAIGVYLGNPNAHNYATLLMSLELQKALRTRSRFSATSVDQLPHMLAAQQMFGHQLLLPVPDLERTDLLVIVGGNPVVSNGSLMTAPGMGRRLREIRARGGRVVVVDPRRTETTALADEHVPIRPGTDALLLFGMLHAIVNDGLVRFGPWKAWTDGLEKVEALAARFPPERVEAATGVPAARIRELAHALASTPRAALYGRLGLSTQAFGGLGAWLLVVLNVVTDHLDRPGGMMFTRPAVDLVAVGARVGQAGHFDRYRSRVRGLPEFGGELPAAAMAEEMETPGDGQIRALLTVAGNPVLSTPDGARLARAIAGLDFVVAVDPWLTATSRLAHLVLPPLSHLERDHYGLAFHALAARNAAKYSPPVFAPPEGALDDWQILLHLAERLHRRQGGARGRLAALRARATRALGPRRALDLGLRAGPHGALRDRRGHALTLARLEAAPDGIDLGPLEPCLPDRLYTPDKRVALAPPALLADVARLEQALEAGALVPPPGSLLLIGRRQQRSNNSWLHNSRRLVKGPPRCTLLMHPDDAAARGLADGQTVTVRSRVGAVDVPLAVDDAMMPGTVSLPHGWGHRRKGARLEVAVAAGGESANDLTDPALLDELSGTSALNGVPVEVAPAA